MISRLKKIIKAKLRGAFPKKILKQWLQNRREWNHGEWLDLLEMLRQEGYATLTESEEGREQIGNFLEDERER